VSTAGRGGVAALTLGVVVAIAAIHGRQQKEAASVDREALLRTQLADMRTAISDFRRENGRHPRSLEELVPKHLETIPVDPMTGSASTWRLTTEDVVAPNSDFMKSTPSESISSVVDVHSGAGRPYSEF
jgi:hypothetical protein